jgi:hypothetical protein
LGGRGRWGGREGSVQRQPGSRVDEFRTTVQEGDFQESTKGVFNVQMGWEKGKKRKGGGKKGSQGGA